MKGGASCKPAEELMKAGKSDLKTGIFKWSPDYVQAAINFEKAAKLFKQAGLTQRAIDAYLEYSKVSESSNELLGAAEGLNEAAFLTDDRKQALKWLQQADEFYKIQGQSERGLTQMKRLAQQLLDKDTPEADAEALKLYSLLFEQVFQNDNYLFNSDIIDTFYKLQLKQGKLLDAIGTKRRLIKYLKDEKTIDHQIRRCYLEIVILQVLI